MDQWVMKSEYGRWVVRCNDLPTGYKMWLWSSGSLSLIMDHWVMKCDDGPVGYVV